MVAQDACTAVAFSLSPGNCHDAPEGEALLQTLNPPFFHCPLIMDRAYEGDSLRKMALDLGFSPVVPPKSNRLKPWSYDKNFTKNEMKLNDCLGD